MVRCGLGMQQGVMHNATIQKTTFFELGYTVQCGVVLPNLTERCTFL